LNSYLTTQGLSKSYGNHVVLRNLNIKVNRGEFFFLLGPSGCGKTTLLRLLSGLISPDEGIITLNGVQIQSIPAHKRDVNTVFQNYALFPHLSVFQNVSFGLKMKNIPDNQIRKTVFDMLDLVGLDSFADRMPSELSGGQMQRVALARALANKPAVLLLDEPLGALDVKLRKQMQYELRRIQKDLGTTFVCVTHDQEEALSIGDRIALMNNGMIEQMGTPRELYKMPVNHFVCDFLGEANFFDVYNPRTVNGITQFEIEANGSTITIGSNQMVDTDYVFSLRPEDIHLFQRKSSIPEGYNSIQLNIRELRFVGPFYEIEGTLSSGKVVTAKVIGSHAEISVLDSTEVYACWSPSNGMVIKRP
jgi:spermidine/putrescine transport system ATP-binding protein